MACLLSCSRHSEEGSEKTDLNWSFSMVAFFLLSFSSFPLCFNGATPCVCDPFCVLWISRIGCCFLVWPHFHLEILCCLCKTNMPKVFVFFQILCSRLCSVGMLCWIYLIPFASQTASFVFLNTSLVNILPMVLCLLFRLSFWGQTNLGIVLVLSLDHSTYCLLSINRMWSHEWGFNSWHPNFEAFPIFFTVEFNLPRNLFASYWHYVTFDIDIMVSICRDTWYSLGVVHTCGVLCEE